jgi:hypothetical protein
LATLQFLSLRGVSASAENDYQQPSMHSVNTKKAKKPLKASSMPLDSIKYLNMHFSRAPLRG